MNLGSIDRAELNFLIQKINISNTSLNQRVSAWSKYFLGTKFKLESKLQDLAKDQLRVEIGSMDCITFIYNCIALAGSSDLNSLVNRLYQIRYRNDDDSIFINNDQINGNFFDFAAESLLFNCVDKNIIKDVTAEVAGPENVVPLKMKLKKMIRPVVQDEKHGLIYPKYPNKNFNTQFIPSECVKKINFSKVLLGDIVLFTRVEIQPNQPNYLGEQEFFVSHAAIVDREDGELYMIHATKNFWVDCSKKKYCNKPYDEFDVEECDKEYLGVWYAGAYLGDKHRKKKDGLKYFGYDKWKKRSLSHFAESLFSGIKIIRLVG